MHARSTPHAGIGALLLLGALAAACGAGHESPSPNDPTGPSLVASVPPPSAAPTGAAADAPDATAPTAEPSPPPLASAPEDAGDTPALPEGRFGPKRCRLPEPKLSDDACSTDADCGPSEPCHAPACVAKAKSKPAGPGVACTRILRCDTADANRCGCWQGRCALIPPSP